MKTKTFSSLKQNLIMAMALTVLLIGMQFTLNADEKQEINKSFAVKDNLQIKTVSGDCFISPSNENKIIVRIVYNYPTDYFTPEFFEEGNTLILKEKFNNAYREHSWRNKYIRWYVTLPAKTRVEFHSASGDIKAEGLKNGLKIKTASGDIEAKEMEGDLIVNTASGDLKVKHLKGAVEMVTASGDIKGEDVIGNIDIKASSGDVKLEDIESAIDIKTSSGDIEIKGVKFTGASQFSLASGDIDIRLSAPNKYDLTCSTASGDMVIDYNGQPVKGYFVYKGKTDNFSSDLNFVSENVSRYSAYGKKYLDKGDSPRITLKTASGDCHFNK